MGKHPKFDKLDRYFEKGKDFQLTDAQYEKMTGIPLPKDGQYTMKKSSLAKHATKNGYYVAEVQDKTVYFKKK